MKEITPGIFAETHYWGCNPGVVFSDDKAVLIDCPLRPEQAIEWRREIEDKANIVCLINTESHLDHTLSNYIFKDIPIISHFLTRDAVAADTVDRLKETLKIYQEPVILPDDFTICPPDITFEKKLVIHLGDIHLEVLHMPGHTAGQSSVYVPEKKVIFTGDNIFYKVQTFLQDALPDEWLASLKQIEGMDIESIVPGHGEICNPSYIKEQTDFIKEWLNKINESLQKNWSLEEAKENISFLARYPMDVGLANLGPRLQLMNIERLYTLLSKNRNK